MNRKKILLFFFILIFIFLFSNIVNAACSIGANPLSMESRAVPGQTVFATWNLYNLYGDRTTHVKLSTIEAPSDWKISFEPELRRVTYKVMGVIQKIEENVAVKVMPVVETKPETIPEGMGYVKHPKEEGYIPVKVVKIYVKVPEDAELWKDHDLVFGATGNCFTEPGAVVPGVATQLKLKVKTISEEFTEVPLEKAPEEKEEVVVVEEEKPTAEPKVIEKEVKVGVSMSTFVGVVVVLIILIIIILIFFVKEKK